MDRRTKFLGLVTSAGLVALGAVGMLASMGQAPDRSGITKPRSACPEAEARQFDFLIGEWKMDYTQIAADGSKKFFPGQPSVVKPMNGGCTLIDTWGGNYGFTVRMWSPTEKKWRFMWIDRENSRGHMQVWEGTIEDGVGTFIGGDRAPHARGRIFSKIVFSEMEQDSLHWEMFHSPDNGKTWRLTDIREYTRAK